MEWRKTIIFLMIAIFLFSIAAVSASDVDDMEIAGEDANQIELSASNEMNVDNLKTSEENTIEIQAKNNKSMSAALGSKLLDTDTGTYSGLSSEIGSGGNIELQHDYYTYDSGNTIEITIDNTVIDGKGAVIDMDGSNIRAFYVTASSVTIKNLSIINANYEDRGGAIYFNSSATSGTVTNCNFTNNTATHYGGAVYFQSTGEVTNCNFTNNKATVHYSYGGAVYFLSTGEVTNCNFTNNTAEYGGAVWIYSGTVTNCNFTNNTATHSAGAVLMDYGSVENCNFTNNTATHYGGAVDMYSGSVENCNFTNNTATRDGGAVYFQSTGEVTNCNFTNNTATNNGGAINFEVTGNVTNCNFTNNTASRNGSAVYFQSTGEVTNCNFTNNKATGDYSYGGAVYFQITGNVTNCNFTNNTVTNNGGAVYFEITGNVTNCNFTNNTATYYDGGAVYFRSNGEVTNCNFINNTAARDGGAIDFEGRGTVTNCSFVDNSANRAGAIFSYEWFTAADTCIFKRNPGEDFNVVIYPPTLDVDDFTTFYGSGEKLRFDLKTNISNVPVTDGNISISVYFKNNETWVVNSSCLSGEGWIPDLPVGSYIAVFNNTEYAGFQPVNRTVTITIPDVQYYINVTSDTTINKTVNFTAKSDIPKDILWDGKLLFILPNGTEINANYEDDNTWWAVYTFDEYGEYNITASYAGLNNVLVNKGTITLNKEDSTIKLDNIVLDYGDSKNVTVTTTGATAITAKIDGNDIAVINDYTIPISALAAGNHTLTVTTIADEDHNPVTKEVNITVNKLSTEITVNNETLNLKVNDEFAVIANLNPAGAGKPTYSSSNESLVKVSDEGLIKALSEGSATVTVSFEGNENYTASQNKTISVTVTLYDASVSAEDIELNVSDTATISPVTSPEGLEVTYVPDNSGVVTVDENGVITAIKEGTATVTLTVGGDGVYVENSTTITVTVKKIDTSIDIDASTLDLEVGDNTIISATLTPAGAGNLTYASSNSSVVTVDDEGNIKAVGAGNAKITVSYSGDDKYKAAENKTVTVTVSLKDASISAEDIELNVSDTATISPVTSPEGLEVTYVPDNSGVITVDEKGVVTALKEGTATITLTVGGDGVYTENSTTITVTVNKINTPINVYIPENITVGDNSTVNVVLPKDAKGNVTVKVDGELLDTVTVKDGNADVTIPSLSAGDHTVEIAYSGDDKYEAASKTATITVAKDSTNITASGVTATYKVNKYLVITLKDSHGNPLANSTVTVDLNGAKDYVSDENGQVKVKVSNLVPKTYTAKIKFEGSDNYLGSDATAKVVVKKASPKITASNKMFKTTTKTKKYTITLKDNTGKAIKNAKVYLKVNGKTYTAKTNSKGQATFKITKLNKKGTFKATISYKGSKYFNKLSKKVNLKVISSWKTISKGSKEKSTVKEIQRALKNHGYYLTAYGHYLKIDGIYWDHTVKAVKQFQKAKSLKVTGKVDEKTAKKLGII